MPEAMHPDQIPPKVNSRAAAVEPKSRLGRFLVPQQQLWSEIDMAIGNQTATSSSGRYFKRPFRHL